MDDIKYYLSLATQDSKTNDYTWVDQLFANVVFDTTDVKLQEELKNRFYIYHYIMISLDVEHVNTIINRMSIIGKECLPLEKITDWLSQFTLQEFINIGI